MGCISFATFHLSGFDERREEGTEGLFHLLTSAVSAAEEAGEGGYRSGMPEAGARRGAARGRFGTAEGLGCVPLPEGTGVGLREGNGAADRTGAVRAQLVGLSGGWYGASMESDIG